MNSFQEMEETPMEKVPEENILKSVRRLTTGKTAANLWEISRRLLERRESPAELETYLKGIVDFVKWTSTINIAAMLWIGSNINEISKPSQYIAIAALICLAGSLILAISAAMQVLSAWGKQSMLAEIGGSLKISLQIFELWLDYAEEVEAIHKVAGSRRKLAAALEKTQLVLPDTEVERLLEFIQELKALSERFASLFNIPDRFERYIEAVEVLGDRPHFFSWIILHTGSLVMGLSLYVSSQMINSMLGVI